MITPNLTNPNSKSKLFFYILSAVVALVGLNIHFGVTLYLSRLLIILFFTYLLVKICLNGLGDRLKFNKTFGVLAALFALIIIQHLMSVTFSERINAGLRQIFIYISLMTLFLIVISINLPPRVIITGLKIYLAVGFFQGCYGIYQVVGGPIGLPMYQNFIFWPTSGDKTSDGILYSGALGLFRATGFLPGDVSHYAAYMATIILLAVSFLMINSRSISLKLGLLISLIALLLSLSRSGMLALIIFGFPALIVINARLKIFPEKHSLRFIRFILGVSFILVISAVSVADAIGYDLFYLFETLYRRVKDLIDVGVDPRGSANIHIITRQMALDAFGLNPLMGVGLGVNASMWFSETFNAGWTGAHSHHFDILGQTGIIGATLEWCFMFSVGSYMWRGLRNNKAPTEERTVLAGLFAIFILIVFGNLLYHYFLNDFVWYLLATGTALNRAILKEYK